MTSSEMNTLLQAILKENVIRSGVCKALVPILFGIGAVLWGCAGGAATASTAGSPVTQGQSDTKAEQRADDCETAINAVDSSTRRIKRAEVPPKEPEKMVERFRAYAKVCDDEANSVDAVAVKTEELAPLLGRYATAARDAAVASRDLADTMAQLFDLVQTQQGSPDLRQKMTALEKEGDGVDHRLEAATENMRQLVTQISNLCQSD